MRKIFTTFLMSKEIVKNSVNNIYKIILLKNKHKLCENINYAKYNEKNMLFII